MRDNVALSWNTAALEAVRRTRMGPPIVARALHVLHAAMYDTWAAHDEVAFGSRLGDRVRRPPADRTEAARREAASFAAHRALIDLFPSEAAGWELRPRGPRPHPEPGFLLQATQILADSYRKVGPKTLVRQLDADLAET